jgi:hypothetical protein
MYVISIDHKLIYSTEFQSHLAFWTFLILKQSCKAISIKHLLVVDHSE